MYLLDANVLIALGDPFHVHHPAVSKWFAAHRQQGWATCPLTENAFLRILGQPQYPKSPGPPDVVRRLLNQLCEQPGHQFFPDTLSFGSSKTFPRLPTSRHLTDLYLLALAQANHARLATIDQYIDPELLPRGREAYLRIDV